MPCESVSSPVSIPSLTRTSLLLVISTSYQHQALEGVYDQLDVRRRELIRLEEDLRLARVKRGTVEEEVTQAATSRQIHSLYDIEMWTSSTPVDSCLPPIYHVETGKHTKVPLHVPSLPFAQVALARVALSGLRRNVSHMKVEKVKVAKEHDRAVAKHEEHVKAVSEAEAKKLVRGVVALSSRMSASFFATDCLASGSSALLMTTVLIGPLEQADESFKAFAFNEYKSSLIPVDREIPDTRVQECQAINWDIPLPKTSIIICFVDESWSALIRTIYSVINRAPVRCSALIHFRIPLSCVRGLKLAWLN